MNELHIVGITSMFISSKYEEIYPMRLKIVYEKIAHKKLSVEEIKKKEIEILETLNYTISNSTVFDFLALTFFKIKPSLNLDN
jgi:hypothetical protein